MKLWTDEKRALLQSMPVDMRQDIVRLRDRIEHNRQRFDRDGEITPQQFQAYLALLKALADNQGVKFREI